MPNPLFSQPGHYLQDYNIEKLRACDVRGLDNLQQHWQVTLLLERLSGIRRISIYWHPMKSLSLVGRPLNSAMGDTTFGRLSTSSNAPIMDSFELKGYCGPGT